MMRLSKRSLIFVLLCTGACSQDWPADGEKKVRDRLSKGPQGMDCYRSAWMKKQQSPSYAYFNDSDICKSNLKIVRVTKYEDRVTGVARCRVGSIEAEFSVSVFRSKELTDSWGGYFCSEAYGKNLSQFPAGSITADDGGM